MRGIHGKFLMGQGVLPLIGQGAFAERTAALTLDLFDAQGHGGPHQHAGSAKIAKGVVDIFPRGLVRHDQHLRIGAWVSVLAHLVNRHARLAQAGGDLGQGAGLIQQHHAQIPRGGGGGFGSARERKLPFPGSAEGRPVGERRRAGLGKAGQITTSLRTAQREHPLRRAAGSMRDPGLNYLVIWKSFRMLSLLLRPRAPLRLALRRFYHSTS